MRRVMLMVAVLVASRCGMYTFSGSTLPSHLKTVDIPILVNQSMEPNIAETITRELNHQILSGNLLRIVAKDGDATITGSVSTYVHEPYTFGASSERQVNVEQYIVKITADIEFFDNVRNEPLFKGPITGQGIYDFVKENEETGKSRAILDMVQRILQNSLQSW